MKKDKFIVNDDMFGVYVKISTGTSRDMHIYKVIGQIESNGYCDIPIMSGAKCVWHSEIVPVLNVVHCGVSEDTIIRVALSDCEIIKSPNDPLTLEELIAILEGLPEITGEPVFVLHKSGARQWHLLKSIGSYAGHRFVLWEDRKMDLLDDYGINCWAYRRKPVEVLRGLQRVD